MKAMMDRIHKLDDDDPAADEEDQADEVGEFTLPHYILSLVFQRLTTSIRTRF